MDESSPAVPTEPLKKRPGRRPRTPLAAKNVATPAKADAAEKSKDDPAEKNDSSENAENAEGTEKTDEPGKSDKADKSDKAEKVDKPSLTERKQAKKEQIAAIIASGGRGKRTPKPNPRYMDEPVVSAKRRGRDDHADSENAEGEDGDDEMNHSSDEPRHEGPLKKRMLQKAGIKPMPNRKPGSAKNTPINRKPGGLAAAKRKIVEVDIDIDDEHGKQLFLDAKRRLTQSPMNSDEDPTNKKQKLSVSDALAAQLRSKYSSDLPVKRNANTDIRTIVNRSRVMDKSKIIQQKLDVDNSARKRKLTEDTETSEDDFSINKSNAGLGSASPKHFNRRKTQHTKILSDDKIVRAAASVPQPVRRITPGLVAGKIVNKMPLAQSQMGQKLHGANAPAKTYSISQQSRTIGANKPAILRPPPRILNSSLCKPTNKPTVPSLVTKLVTKDDYENDTNKQRNNNIMQSRSKENNVTSYTYTEKDGKMVPKKVVTNFAQLSQHKIMQQRKPALPVVRTQPRQQKIISEPVNMSRFVRKITCFETWYVIRTAELKPKPERSILSLSLMQIGNEIRQIVLPSDEWTYKILLQPLTKQMIAMRDAKCAIKNKSKLAVAAAERESSDAKANKSTTDVDEKPDATVQTAADAADAAATTVADSEPKSTDEKADAKPATDSSATDKRSSEKKAEAKMVDAEVGKQSDSNEDAEKAEKTEKKDNKRGGKRILRNTRSQKAEAERSAEETDKDEEKMDVGATGAQEKLDDKATSATDDEGNAKGDTKPNVDIKEETSADESSASNGKQDDAQPEDTKPTTDAIKSEDVSDAEVKKADASDAVNTHDYYTGEVHDPHINPDERHNYRPVNIMFRRKCQNSAIRIQFDRTVILKNETFYLNIDGKNVRLVGSPQSIESYADLEVLLQIVDNTSLKSCCVESTTAIA